MIVRPAHTALSLAPTLTTLRLTLRMDDSGYRAAFYASDRAVHEGGPFSREAAWRIFASEVGQWPLFGYGPFSVDDRETGDYLGEVGIYQPEGYPEPELGWFVTEATEGRGIAAEAARAVMHWARQSFGWDHIDNYIGPANSRSIALAECLDAVPDPDAATPDSGDDLVCRHPTPGGRA